MLLLVLLCDAESGREVVVGRDEVQRFRRRYPRDRLR